MTGGKNDKAPTSQSQFTILGDLATLAIKKSNAWQAFLIVVAVGGILTMGSAIVQGLTGINLVIAGAWGLVLVVGALLYFRPASSTSQAGLREVVVQDLDRASMNRVLDELDRIRTTCFDEIKQIEPHLEIGPDDLRANIFLPDLMFGVKMFFTLAMEHTPESDFKFASGMGLNGMALKERRQHEGPPKSYLPCQYLEESLRWIISTPIFGPQGFTIGVLNIDVLRWDLKAETKEHLRAFLMTMVTAGGGSIGRELAKGAQFAQVVVTEALLPDGG